MLCHGSITTFTLRLHVKCHFFETRSVYTFSTTVIDNSIYIKNFKYKTVNEQKMVLFYELITFFVFESY